MASSNNLLVDTDIILYAVVYNDDIATELLTENTIFGSTAILMLNKVVNEKNFNHLKAKQILSEITS